MSHSTKVAKESANKNQTNAPAKTVTSPEQAEVYTLEDLRDETVTQRKLQSMMQQSDTHASLSKLQSAIQNSPRSAHIAQLQNDIDNSPRMQAQRKSMDLNQHRSPMQLVGMNINDEPQLEHEADVMGAKVEKLGHQYATQQRKEDPSKKPTNIEGNDQLTGFPNLLKAGFATMGHDINPTVHYNSTKPAQLNALAYAQGNDIHLGAGQEQHLPHEAWHVLQQRQGRVASTAQFFGHENRQTPLNLGESAGYSPDGIAYTSMSDAAYADWRQTVQCKMGLHGAYTYGGKTTIAQFNNPAEVMQMISLSKNAKAVLLVLEGVLTISAGIGALAATGGVAVIPAVYAICAGIIKLLRAYLTYQGDEKASDLLRFVEAGYAIVGGAVSGNPAIIVFAFAKLLRSILAFFVARKDDGEKEKSVGNKIIMSVSTVLHAVEVAALAFAGGANISEGLSGAGDTSLVLGGAAVLGIAASKGIRTADQGKGAYNAKVEKKTKEEPSNSARTDAETMPETHAQPTLYEEHKAKIKRQQHPEIPMGPVPEEPPPHLSESQTW
jgi:uncharacterized protein DUF4157